MSFDTLELSIQNAVAVVWLNRPEVRNAFNQAMITELRTCFEALSDRTDVRAVVLAARGKAFCAGADLSYMQALSTYTREQNEDDGYALASMLQTIAQCPKPVVARIHGPCFAGGMGLASVCDIAVASHEASFCLSEVRLGLIPATIAPHVVRAMGTQSARRYFLSAERFDAAEAYRIGFVHELCAADTLDDTVNALLGQLLQGAPGALADAKALVRDVSAPAFDDALLRDTASRIARARASEEGREGIASFLQKRSPRWKPDLE